MADSSLLASILSGQDPLSAQMLNAYQGSQLSNAAIDPSFGHNEGWGGALAKTIAGIRGGGMTSDAVNQLVAARAANRPELAQVMASDDPYKMIGANPSSYSDQTLAALLAGATPGSVSDARLKAAQAAGARLNLSGYQGTQALIQNGGIPLTGPVAGKMGGAVTGAAAHSGDVSALGSGRYAQPAADNAGAAPDPIAAAGAMSVPQRQALVQNPQQRAAILARLRAMMPRPQAQPGALGAAQP